MKEQIVKSISGIISISANDIQSDPSAYGLGSPDTWDSLAHLAIMSEMEDALGVEISIEKMEEMNDAQKILNYLDENIGLS